MYQSGWNEYLVSLLTVSTVQDPSGETKWLVHIPPKRAVIAKLIAKLVEDDSRDDAYAFIENVVVNKAFQGNGLGNYLLSLCKDYFSDVSYVELEAEEDMERYGKLVRFYELNGFKEMTSAERHGKLLYNGDQTFRVVNMRCNDLTFVANAPLLCNVNNFNTVEFAEDMRKETMSSTRATMTMVEGLKAAEAVVAGTISKGVQLCEALEKAGHPEWLQAMGLIYYVGCISHSFAWTTPVKSSNIAGVRKSYLPCWAESTDSSTWSNAEYLNTLLNLREDNQSRILVPEEGLMVLSKDVDDDAFWHEDFKACSVAASALVVKPMLDKHVRLLDMYFPEPVNW